MKIVQSYWSKPSIKVSFQSSTKKFGGWRQRKYELMSWALSCLTHRSCYSNVELVTDNLGKSILIDKLQLPYTSVNIKLEEIRYYPPELWAAGKIMAYGIQEEPFIHVDNDIFIWDKYPSRIENATLIAQHEDLVENDYRVALNHLQSLSFNIPILLKEDMKKVKGFKASNAGIIGGNNFKFFEEYSRLSLEFINSNLEKIDENLLDSAFAIFYEQYLYSVFAREKGLKIEHLFNKQQLKNFDFTDFMNRYQKEIKYVHLFSTSKNIPDLCYELELHLASNFPKYHRKILNLIS